MGSSIPFWAGELAATQPGGRNLNLPACIKWHAIRGLQWQQLDPHILKLLRTATPPNFLVIHLGSNDLTTTGLTSKKLIEEIQCSFLRYNVLLPNTKLIWSSILPRLYWHGAPLNCGGKIDKKRKKINRKIRSFVLDLGGAVISHPNISPKVTELFRHDGAHLSMMGNRLYLHNLQGGLSSFLSNTAREFP